MRIIGDIHGKIPPYLDLISGCESSVQIGDFGMGFNGKNLMDKATLAMAEGDHKFFRGNHDDPALCKAHPHCIDDGFYDEARDTMYVGGAWSIDLDYRQKYDAIHGTTSWWADEECTVSELIRIHADYVYHKPKIMITHDAPMQVSKELFFQPGHQMYGPHQSTRTAEFLQAMFMEHQPELWIFGHWHISKDEVIDGTRFVCLAELEHLDI